MSFTLSGFSPAFKKKGDIYLFKLQNFTSAIIEYDKALLLSPGSIGIINNRGVAKYSSGDLTGAIIDYEKVIKLSPEHAIAHFNKGMINIELGNKDIGCIDLHNPSCIFFLKIS